ncbi:6077_t:CDS:2, partial [Racocetra fulgida]
PFEPAHVHVLTSDMTGEMKVWLNESLDIEECYNIPRHNKNFSFSGFRLLEGEKLQPTILEVECDKEFITAHLSDSRSITIPTG